MTYKLLITTISEKRAQYFVTKYLIEQLAFNPTTAKSLLATLPALVAEKPSLEELHPLEDALIELGATTQINLPNIKYCLYHIDQAANQTCPRCAKEMCERCSEINTGICTGCAQTKQKWHRWKRYRQSVAVLILLVVAISAAKIHYNDRRKLEWDRAYRVALIEVINVPDAQTKITPLSASGKEELAKTLNNWFSAEIARVHKSNNRPFRFEFLGPIVVDQPAPPLPKEEEGWWQRYKETSSFIEYFTSRFPSTHNIKDFDIKVYLYLYYDKSTDGSIEQEPSVATTRGRFGVVFLPIGKQGFGRTTCLIAHELLHTVGATDKYTNDRTTVYPEGYFLPQPRYPQQFAEIMALATPLAPGKEIDASNLDNCRIGQATATEIGW